MPLPEIAPGLLQRGGPPVGGCCLVVTTRGITGRGAESTIIGWPRAAQKPLALSQRRNAAGDTRRRNVAGDARVGLLQAMPASRDLVCGDSAFEAISDGLQHGTVSGAHSQFFS
jgi:hypothetical protein